MGVKLRAPPPYALFGPKQPFLAQTVPERPDPQNTDNAGVPEKLRCAGDGLLFCSDEAQDTHTEAAPRSPTHILRGGYYKFEDKDSAERKPATLEMEGVLYRHGPDCGM